MQVNVRLSADDAAALRARAAESGTTVSDLVRRAAISAADGAERRITDRIAAAEARLYARIDAGQEKISQSIQQLTDAIKSLLGARHEKAK